MQGSLSLDIVSTEKIKAVSDLSDKEWDLAIERYGIIAPIINGEPKVTVENNQKALFQ